MKALIKKMFGFAGYKLERLQQFEKDCFRGYLTFGPYKIKCHNASQIKCYASVPSSNKYLGRLALVIQTHNPESPQIGIIDVGANCGDTAALMRSQTNLPILCIEGDSKLYSLLQQNMRQCSDITIVHSYIGEATGPLSVKIEKEGWNNTLVPSETAGSVIQICRLDDLSNPWLSRRRIGLLKIDTEGFDVSILFGAKKLLETSKPVIAFEYNRDGMDAISESGLRVFPYLKNLDYESLMIYDNYGRFIMATTVQNLQLLKELHRFIERPKRGIHYFDMVAFPKAGAVLFQKFRDAEIANDQDRNGEAC
jgi:FkbM family methyltransferase